MNLRLYVLAVYLFTLACVPLLSYLPCPGFLPHLSVSCETDSHLSYLSVSGQSQLWKKIFKVYQSVTTAVFFLETALLLFLYPDF